VDVPGAQIHGEHPFLLPSEERVPVRRVRGRLPTPVTLWTTAADGDRAGLTVSSTLVVEPGLVLGVVGPDSDLADLLEESATAVVHALDWRHRRLADVFAFVAPAPGGPFRTVDWTDTTWGPVLQPEPTWMGIRVRAAREVGYGLLVEADVEHTHVEEDPPDPLAWYRGDYRHLA
jgi:flavin reductase (DIM6/NTAB) family NADH-FMN oxidoreductase RutF